MTPLVPEDRGLLPLIRAWLCDVCAGRETETETAYTNKLNHLLVWCAGRDAATITADDMSAWRAWLIGRRVKRRGWQTVAGSLSPATIHTVITTVKMFFAWASDTGRLPANPAAGLRNIPLPPPEPKAISADTVQRLINAAALHGERCCERVRNVAIIAMLRDTGGRVGGLINARLPGLDLDSGRVFTREKGRRSRYLYLTPPTREALRAWLAVRHEYAPTDGALFVGRFGRGLGRGGIYSMLRRVALAANIPAPYNPHSFRHAFARDMLRDGVDLSRVSQMMGHSRITVTADYYARWADTELQADHAAHSPARQLTMPMIMGDVAG